MENENGNYYGLFLYSRAAACAHGNKSGLFFATVTTIVYWGYIGDILA